MLSKIITVFLRFDSQHCLIDWIKEPQNSKAQLSNTTLITLNS